MSTPCCNMCVAKLCRSECGRKFVLKPQAARACINAARAVASGRCDDTRRLGKSQRWLWWVFQTARSIWSIESVSGKTRSLLRLPMTRRTICLESTAEMGSVTASLIRKP